MGQDPSEIRQDIEQTRAEMGDTVEALSYKTDVKARAKDAISDRVDSVKSRVDRAGGVAQENPLGLALGAVAVGFVAGLAIPATRAEDERIGHVADQVKDRAKETGEEALERGKQVAQDAAQSAKETAQQAGQEHAEELKESARQSGREAAPMTQ